MLKSCRIATHPYLKAKGFPKLKARVWREWGADVLIVPVYVNDRLSSLEMIQPDGQKRFLKGGKVPGGVYHLGNGRFQVWVEGHATGLSVWKALAVIHDRKDIRVTVCFSAHNPGKVAREAGRGVIVADNDANEKGLKAARATGLPFWMPDEPGDANDYHQKHGTDALAFELMALKDHVAEAA